MPAESTAWLPLRPANLRLMPKFLARGGHLCMAVLTIDACVRRSRGRMHGPAMPPCTPQQFRRRQ
eukprot:COSAG05_NODE_760_length_7489_cov_1.989716_2_plen_65_part_00